MTARIDVSCCGQQLVKAGKEAGNRQCQHFRRRGASRHGFQWIRSGAVSSVGLNCPPWYTGFTGMDAQPIGRWGQARLSARVRMAKRKVRVMLAEPRSFCAGVVRAIEIVERALDVYGPPVYVRNKIVHNEYVVADLSAKGVRFVSRVEEIPDGAITIFSAHGVSRKVEDGAKGQGLQVIDATCPLVKRVHNEAKRYSRKGYEIILIGHPGHPEVEGTLGRVDGPIHLVSDLEDVRALVPKDPEKLAYVTQTTLGVDDTRGVIDELKRRFPHIRGPDVKDICYATQNRQEGVRRLAEFADVILVLGASYSSNSTRLREVGESSGAPSYLIPDADALDPTWLDGATTIGITAGASAPERLVEDLIERLGELFDTQVVRPEEFNENVVFNLPRELTASDRLSA